MTIGGIGVKAGPHDVEITSVDPPAVPVDDIRDLSSVNRDSEAGIHPEDRSRRRESDLGRVFVTRCRRMASEER